MFKSQSINIRFMVTAFVSVLMFACTVRAQDNALRKNLEALYAKRDQAVKAKDAASVNALLAEDFTSKGLDGTIKNRAQVVAGTNAVIGAMEGQPTCLSKIESVRQGKNQNEAIVEFSERITATMKLPDGTLHAFDAKDKVRDTWVRAGGSWRLKYQEVLESSGSVDGKPMPQPGRKDESQTTANGDTARPIASERQAAANSPVEVQFDKWQEPKERSFTVEVPHGWQVTGGLNWTGPLDPQQFIQAQSADGTMLIFIGDPKILPRLVPSQWSAREGTVFTTSSGGPALVQRFLTGSQFAKQHVTSGRPCENPRWVSEGDLPELSRSIAHQLEPQARSYNLNVDASSGEAGFFCDNVQGFVSASTIRVSRPGNPIQIWTVFQVAGFVTSNPMKSMEARYIMEHMLGTMMPNSQWDQAFEDRARRVTGMVISMQNAALEVQMNAARSASNDLSRMNHPYQGPTSRTGPHLADSSGNTRLCDGIGRCASVSNTSGPVFMDRSGNVRQGSGSGEPPDKTGVWTPLYP